MQKQAHPLATGRIEAFSDGVLAILITIMVFDLKLQEATNSQSFLQGLKNLLPKFLSYINSFLVLAIMWVSHHQLFHQIRHTDRKLLWYNVHLLFWMSLIPFATNAIGAAPFFWPTSLLYGMVLFMTAASFSMLRRYVVTAGLLFAHIAKASHGAVLRKNLLALMMYLCGALAGVFSVYISFALFFAVPGMYFIPERISTNLNEND